MLKEHEEAKDTVAYEAIKRIGAIYHLDNQLAELKLGIAESNGRSTSILWRRLFCVVKEIQASDRLIIMQQKARYFYLHKHAWKLTDSIDGAKSSAIVYASREQ